MPKKLFGLLLAAILLCGTAACGGAMFSEPEVSASGVLPGKIAIITDQKDAYYQGSKERYYSARQLAEEYGPEDIIHFTWPKFWHDSDAEDKMRLVMEEIANDQEIKILIIAYADSGTDAMVSELRKQRNDLFIAYAGYNANNYGAPFVDLILNINIPDMKNAIIEQAGKLGAKTLVSFCYSIDDFYNFELSYDYDDYFEELGKLRKKCQEIGLDFVEVHGLYEIQCGSSLHAYMEKNIPKLVEQYGKDIAFMGLDDDRLLWYCLDGLLYPSPYVDPSPLMIASALFIPALAEMESSEEFYYIDNLPHIIAETRNALKEKNMLGRVSTWPVPADMIFTYAAAEYGVKWINGEVPKDGIDVAVLGQIMTDFIAESTGEEGLGVSLKPLSVDGEVYPNNILVLMDYMVY